MSAAAMGPRPHTDDALEHRQADVFEQLDRPARHVGDERMELVEWARERVLQHIGPGREASFEEQRAYREALNDATWWAWQQAESDAPEVLETWAA